MPRDGKLTETDVVTLLQSGCVLVVSELTRRAKLAGVTAFVVDPETEREWPVGPSAPVSWSGRWVSNQAHGDRVPDQVVGSLGDPHPEHVTLVGGLRWKLWYLTLGLSPYGRRSRLHVPALYPARRVHWERVPTPESEQKRSHPRPLPAEEVRHRLVRGHELLRVRYWRAGPRSKPKGPPTGWVQDPEGGEPARVPQPLLRYDYHQRELLPPFTQLRRQHERCVRIGRANWEVVAFTAEPTRDWLSTARTLTDEDGVPLPLGTQARVLETLEAIEERVSPAPDWIMA